MKIYVAHSKNFDYEKELYIPIRKDKELNKIDIILPHEKGDLGNHTRDFYKDIDIFIAEASYKATGLGIELGWAYDDNTPIYVLHKSDIKLSNSINLLTDKIYTYETYEEMLSTIKKIIKNNAVEN